MGKCEDDCINLKCIATGHCIDVPVVASPPLVPGIFDVMLSAALPLIAPTRTIVAFTGLAGSGKSTAAAHLVAHKGYERIRFAGPLKAMMAALGLSPDQIDGHLKETPCDLLGGKTPRQAMQTIGTEWGRNLIADDLWIRAWRAAVDKVPAGKSIVVDDCRFPNEAAAIRAVGGVIIQIVRPGAGSTSSAGHASEGQSLPHDATVHNHGTPDDMHRSVQSYIADASWVRAALLDHAAA